MADFLHKELSQQIIGVFYDVYNTLGYGFLEKVYENAFLHELKIIGLNANPQVPIEVFYKGIRVGQYYADLVIEDKIIIELKAAESLCEAHEFQLLNYLKATNMEVGLLFNFGRKPEFKRLVYTKSFKNQRKSV
ncbi:MAG: GxxExxY protein [Tenuifilaceae bacterium]|nr:GxxExxY protein [Tenuifilaceae bacterium]